MSHRCWDDKKLLNILGHFDMFQPAMVDGYGLGFS